MMHRDAIVHRMYSRENPTPTATAREAVRMFWISLKIVNASILLSKSLLRIELIKVLKQVSIQPRRHTG